ncbi:anther-specific proline-rich protein APG [Andrographis paniculata]|uniref:anther-specific proline-rich protein APG n=1 Tax=Andrographis paniculata TaxID=175694 RepID=UPI0021E83952|nr:anther-specific proline-rich protein APG [Andrographis paniculata]
MAAVSGALLLPTLFALVFFTDAVLSDHSPSHPPSLPPQPPADQKPPSPTSPAPAPAPAPVPAPSPGGLFSSPPAPPAPDLSPTPETAPTAPPTPVPAPADAGEVRHENQSSSAGDLKTEGGSSSGGMSSGQKAGVAIGIIGGACVVGVGAFVYTKRRQNIQRAQYGYAARRELL